MTASCDPKALITMPASSSVDYRDGRSASYVKADAPAYQASRQPIGGTSATTRQED